MNQSREGGESAADILVIDDTPANLQLLFGILTKAGYQVRPAPDGQWGLDAAAARLPNLILLDIRMPGLDGFEVCRRLKAHELTREIPVIFVTAVDDAVDKAEGFRLGAVDYITKPFEAAEILARVKTHLTVHATQAALAKANEMAEGINEVLQGTLTCETEEDLGKICLAVAERLTRSEFGFIAEVNAAGLVDVVAISDRGWEVCDEALSDARHQTKNMPVRGIDRSTILEGISRIVNPDEMASHPDRVGTPPGHPAISAFLGIPLKREGRTVGMIGLGNKVGDYDVADQNAVESLSVAIVEALDRKRADLEVREHRARLAELVDERTKSLRETNEQLQAEIAERKRVQKEREELIAILEAQNAELERFAYTVSHDLKSPLITIQGFVGMLRRDLAERNAASVGDDLSRIGNAVSQMDRLLSDVLELSRIGRLIHPPEDVSMEDLAYEALELVGGGARNRVKVEISPTLPVVFGDRLRLREVLQNLIDNAVKYMGDQPHPRVEVNSRRDGNETICYVHDNGTGIAPRFHEKVFGLFEQLDQKKEGTGVGLALTKRIIEVHGGRIWIESDGSGHGSTFCFTLAPAQSLATGISGV